LEPRHSDVRAAEEERCTEHVRAMHAEIGEAPENCRALSDILSRIGDKWTVMVIGSLGEGPRRFNELKRIIDGISQRMLTLTLRNLERDGLVSRAVFPTIPPRVEYALTPLGRSLLKPIVALYAWGRDNRRAMESARQAFDEREAEDA
jgi:DNA-binding HxlR family transcriptional regulator